MTPHRVDFLIDVAYGLLIFVSILLIVVIQTSVGIAFGVGVLVSYIIHVAWKMARFDPEWMTEQIEETITQEVTETVGERVSKEVTRDVEEKVTQEVRASVAETLSAEITPIAAELEEVNERIDRRPRADEIDEEVETMANEDEDR